jgi:Zn-dependent membrane protease YugP
MMLTFADYTLLVGYISVAAFASYAAHEVAHAIQSYLND